MENFELQFENDSLPTGVIKWKMIFKDNQYGDIVTFDKSMMTFNDALDVVIVQVKETLKELNK